MNARARPIRSAMFVPGNREERMLKAPKYGADALIFDLEDAVAFDQKAAARRSVRAAIEQLSGSGPALFVRINALDSGLADEDLEAVAVGGLYAVMVPKVSAPEEVREVDILLKFFEKRRGLEPGGILIDPLLETAQGLRQAYEVAAASARVAHMGAITGKDGDIARAVGFGWTDQGYEALYILSKVLLDVRAAGVPFPLGGRGWWEIDDLKGLRAEAQRAKQLGYTGMLLIHPSHIPIVNDVFSPTVAEIEHWKGLLAAVEQSEREGSSVAIYQGAMVDTAHAKLARQMLQWARRLGVTP
jgi:citrate lyase subunit beta/citryl-CoA lyase